MIRRSPRALLAALVLAALVVPLAGRPVLAKLPDLTLVTQATYDVLPDEGTVAVTVRITAANRLRDTLTRRFFFRTAYLAVQPGASGFEISADSGSPKVSVRRRAADHTLLRIDLGTNLAAGRTRSLTLRFQITDPGGAPDRSVRISPSLVTFEAWAFATPRTPGSSLRVTLPADYTVEIGRGPLDGPAMAGDGRQTWSSGKLDAPLEFAADVRANRPVELVETTHTVPLASGDAEIVVRAWADDPAWRDRVDGLVMRAVPLMESEIGLPWPLDGPLVIEESLAPAGATGAGVYDPAAQRLELAYLAPDGAILQQLAHAWFNGRLVADRWIADAFALYYGERVGEALGIEPLSPVLTPEQEAAAIPLNAWSPASSAGSGGTDDEDAYARAAALELARAIAERAGSARLGDVWAAAATGAGAYQPGGGGDELAPGLLDWRSLLDLLEEETGRSFGDLWRAWVARPADAAALDDRAGAREHHAATIARAGGWSLPRSVRDALRAWQFGLAEDLLLAADRVLAARETLEARAASLGLTLPDRLQRVFEGEDGFAVAEAEAAAQLEAVEAVRAAREARSEAGPAGGDLVLAMGLLGVDPEAQLAQASAALAAGDVEGAYHAAASAEDLWIAAPGIGRGRIVSLVLLGLSVILLAGLIGRRRRGGVDGPT